MALLTSFHWSTDDVLILLAESPQKVDENMRRAHERDAATKGKFFFRSNIDYAQSPEGGEAGEIYSPCDNDPKSGLEEMTVLQILEGKVGWR